MLRVFIVTIDEIVERLGWSKDTEMGLTVCKALGSIYRWMIAGVMNQFIVTGDVGRYQN